MFLPLKNPSVPRQLHRFSGLSNVSLTEHPSLHFYGSWKFASSSASDRNLLHCYKTLKVPVDCSFDDVREAFIALAKKYHPDGGSPDADAQKFQEVESAYRTLQLKYSNEGKTQRMTDNLASEVTEFDIEHTAPQHRQYLSYDGCGSGTPSQRQRHYQKMRAVQAADNLISHRIRKINSEDGEQALTVRDKVEARKIKTRFGMDRLVEDLIQESMARGEFDNLSGRGKPLKKDNFNPYVDFVTHKLNEVLIENGFTPEWITLQKEIRQEREDLRASLCEKRGFLGPLPLSAEEQQAWEIELDRLQSVVNQINGKINKYNLLVPILHKQMLQIHLQKEAQRILEDGTANLTRPLVSASARMVSQYPASQPNNVESFFSLLSEFWGRK